MKKDLLYFKKSRWLLLVLLTMMVGANSAWADEYTCGFEESEGWSTEKISYVNYTTVGTGWGCIGGETLQYYNVAEGSTYKRTGSQSLTHNASYENSTIYAVTPYLAAGTISFYARYAQSTYNLKIYKASYDGDTYTVEDAICSWSKTGTKLTNTFTQYSFDLDEDSYVAILLDRVAMDDFSAPNGTTTPSGIAKPKSFRVSNVTGSSVDFSWAAGSTETEWELSYSTTSGTPDNGTIIPLTETSYSLTGLTAETTYYASVRAKINDEYSAWSKEVSFTPSNAIKLTVNDGTSTNSYVPIYGNYVDYYDKVEFVIPASDLADMTNSDIKAIQFYMSSVAAASWGNANFKIYMKEVDYTTISSFVFTEDDTPLYNGAIDGTKADMALALSTPYHYNGGNLLVGVYNTVKGSYKAASFYGVSATSGASVYGTNSSSLASITSVTKQSFLPKTTFTYLPVDGPVMKVSESSFDFGTITAESTTEEKTKSFTISNTGTATLEGITVSYSGDNAFSTSPEISAQSIAVGGDAITVTVTMAAETPGDYSGTITVSATDQTPVEIAVSGTYAANPATMSITLGEEAVGSTVAFGNVGKQATKTFTITNTGNLKLNITSIVSSNITDFTVSPATLEVAGGSSETFTVTFVYPNENPVLDTEKTATITVTASNEGIEAKSFTVTGTRIEQWSEDFSGNVLPGGWKADTNYWTFSDGVVKSKYNTWNRNNYLFTPKLTVSDASESLTFSYTTTAGSVSIPIYYSNNGGDYIAYPGTPTSLSNGVSGTFTITGLEAGNYVFRFGNDDYNLDNFEGFKLNADAPILGYYTNSTCTVAASPTESKTFDFVTETPNAQVYYIKNDGTGTMNIALGDIPAGFTAVLGKASLTAGESTTMAINMSEAIKGYHSGNIVLTAKNSSDELIGTFTVAASGVVVDENKLYLDFSSANIPSTWTATNWTKNSTDISTGYNDGTLQTATLTATANEQVVVRAKQEYTSSSYTFGVNYRKVGDEEWSELIAPANIGTNFVTLAGTITEAGNYELQFTGRYVHISNIYGLAEAQEPVMAVYDGESLAGASYDFGNVSDEADATWTLTVKNEGKAALTGLATALSGENAAHYSVEVSATELAVNATATITVKQLKDNIGSHEATLTISADDPIADKVIALSGTTRDHTKLYLDFEDGNFPSTWTNAATNTWTINTQSGNKYLRQYRTATSAILTSALTIADDEVLKFDAKSEYSDATLTVRYTTNGGITWTDYATYTYNNGLTGTFDTKTISGIPAGTVMLQFDGMDVGIDNVYGFAPTTAPMLSLTESAVAVANESTKNFGTLTSEAGTATYVLSNTGTADMVSTIAVTGDVTFEVTAMGEGVTKSENTLTIPAGKTATIVVTMPYAAPFSAKSGAMTITTEGWVGNFTINFTGSTLDPTAFYEDFANNAKPEGWYNSGWTFTSGAAQNGLSGESTFITQKLTVAGTEDMLTYDARAYNISWYTPVLNVSYSTDRKNWTDVAVQPTGLTNDYQTFNVSGLAQGEYYLKFTGSRIFVDNIIGWHKVTSIERDLYVSTSNIPADTKTPETEITATATVYSLRSAEEGVYAKLFFDEELVATAEAQNISKDGSVNFELTGNVPATEKTYAAKIVVYYSDNSVAFETLTTNVEVAHTRTLAITAFTRDGEGAMEADEQNQISPVFNVTVQNNGTTNYESPTVKVFNGEVEVGTATSNATVAPGESAELTVTATNMSAGEGGELSFTAKAYWDAAEFSYATPVVIEVTAAAPKFALYQDATPVNNGDDVEFGLTRIAKTYSYTIKNEGTAPMELVSIVAPTGFTATAVTDENKDIAVNGTLDIDVTLNAEQGKKSGNLVITYKVDANTNKTFTLALSGRSISEDTWTVAFDGTQTKIPSDWTNNGGWLIAGEYSSYPGAVYSSGYSASWLMTPRLAAEEGEELTYDVAGSTVSLKVEYSTNKTDWTTYETVTTTGEQSFIAPAAGNYYLRFTGTYAYLTNFVGFKLNPLDHDTEIASSSVPTTGKQYNTYTATVTLKESAGKAEEVTAKLYVGGEEMATTTETITANGSTVVTLTWEPQTVISEAVKAYVAVTGTGIDLTTEEVDLTVAEVYTLDEESSVTEVETVSDETILLKHTFVAGWNTVCLPFDIEVTTIHANAKAFSFDAYSTETSELTFNKVTTLSASIPYVIYVPEAITEPMKVENVTITSTNNTVFYSNHDPIKFQGTYAKKAAGSLENCYGLTAEGKIVKAKSTTTMKGFRGYFTNIPAEARVVFFGDDDVTTGITNITVEQEKVEGVYNLNGQRVQSLKKNGLYIINGKKVVVK